MKKITSLEGFVDMGGGVFVSMESYIDNIINSSPSDLYKSVEDLFNGKERFTPKQLKDAAAEINRKLRPESYGGMVKINFERKYFPSGIGKFDEVYRLDSFTSAHNERQLRRISFYFEGLCPNERTHRFSIKEIEALFQKYGKQEPSSGETELTVLIERDSQVELPLWKNPQKRIGLGGFSYGFDQNGRDKYFYNGLLLSRTRTQKVCDFFRRQVHLSSYLGDHREGLTILRNKASDYVLSISSDLSLPDEREIIDESKARLSYKGDNLTIENIGSTYLCVNFAE